MPQNQFPDSLEKQTLRRRDAIFLEEFKSRLGVPSLHYCGLTSTEFKDVEVWRPHLASVLAVEINSSIFNDMEINWRRLKLGLPFNIVSGDILDYLRSPSTPCFDSYNLDFYGGFTNPKSDGTSRCRDMILSLCSRHREQKRSFALIATFNVRDRGVEQYDMLIKEVTARLEGIQSVENNLKQHAKSHATKIKLSYTYTCWSAGVTNDFEVEFEDPFVYNSGTSTLVHFCSGFIFRPKTLGRPIAERDALIALSNLPLKRMDGRIARIEMKPDRISRS